MTTSDSTEIHEMISFKVKGERSGKRKIFHKGKSGDEFNHADQRWTVVSRNIDRDNNRYDELITEAATGTILREIHESLSEHRGRGSARRGHRS